MDDKQFENELKSFQPVKLTEQQLNAAELAVFGGELHNITVPTLSDELLDRFCEAIEGKEDDKVIQFPNEKGIIQIPAPNTHKKFAWLPMAAAVAFLGMISALFVTQDPTESQSPTLATTTPDFNSSIVNASRDSRIINAQSSGVYRNSQTGKPYELRRVTVLETIEVTNRNGEKILVKKPVEKMIFTPPTTD